MKQEASIAVAWGSPGGATAEISIAIESLLSKRPKSLRLGDLAGPNETIQVLLNIEDWILIAKGIAVLYGAEIIKESAKATWKNAVPKITEVTKNTFNNLKALATAAAHAKMSKAPVVYGLQINPPGSNRHIGIEILDNDKENIARIISMLANHGNNIGKILEELHQEINIGKKLSVETNSDMSAKIELTDEGRMLIKVKYHSADYKNYKLVEYDLTNYKKA